MRKTAIMLMILTIFSKILGFSRDVILSYYYGASKISDVFLVSQTVPVTIFALIGTGLVTNYIPVYSSIIREKSVRVAEQFTNNFLNHIFLLCTFIIVVVQLFTPFFVKLFASGFEGEILEMAVSFTRISIFSIYLSSFVYIYTGYLQLKNNFIIPALVGLPLNIVLIVIIILSWNFGLIILPIGSVIAVGFQLLFLLPSMTNNGYKYKLVLNSQDQYLKQLLYLSIPVIIGVSVNQINVLVDRTIASQIAIGGISALTYANRLNLFIQGIFVISFVTAMYPTISKMAVVGNIDTLKKTISETIGGVNLLVIPTTIGAMLFSEPIVRLLFARGAFNAQAVKMTSEALFYYSIGMIGFGLRDVLSRTFYSLKDTKTPMINAAISMILNIVLNIVLSRFLGIGGLALATSISALFCSLLLFIDLRKKIGAFGIKKISISFVKIVIASIMMGILAMCSFNMLSARINSNLSLFFAVIIGVLVYFVLVYLFKVEEMRDIILIMKSKLKKNIV